MYHTNGSDEECIRESILSLDYLRNKMSDFSIDVYVLKDCYSDLSILDEDSEDYTVLSTNFSSGGVQMLDDMFNFYASLDYDFYVMLESDVILRTLECIEANIRRQRMTLQDNKLGVIKSLNGGVKIFGKLGINMIKSALIHPLIRKRISNRGLFIYSAIDNLLEMCDVYISKVNSLEGVVGHCIYGKDDISRATSIGFNNDANLMKQYRENELFKEVILPIASFIKDKSVAIVGNADVDKDYSEEIDNHDIVIRLNNFYNIDSGKVGKKVSALLLSGTSAWQSVAPNGQSLHEDIISEQNPQIFLLTETSNQKIENLHMRYKDCPREMLGNKTSDLRYTSGTVLLKMIAKVKGYSKISLYGFDKGSNWKDYVKGNASIHEGVFSEEEQLRMKLFEELCYV